VLCFRVVFHRTNFCVRVINPYSLYCNIIFYKCDENVDIFFHFIFVCSRKFFAHHVFFFLTKYLDFLTHEQDHITQTVFRNI